MTMKSMIQKTFTRRAAVMALSCLLLTVAIVGTYCHAKALGFGATRTIDPNTGRPYDASPVKSSFEPPKVDSRGYNLEPTKSLKNQVVPAVKKESQPTITESTKTSATKIKPVEPSPMPVSPVKKAAEDKSVKQPEVKEEAVQAKPALLLPSKKEVAPQKPNAQTERKPVDALPEKVKVESSATVPTSERAKDIADTKPAIVPVAPKPVEQTPSKIESATVKVAPKPAEQTLSKIESATAKVAPKPAEREPVAKSPSVSDSLSTVQPTAAARAIEWAVTDWQDASAHLAKLHAATGTRTRPWTVARAQGNQEKSGEIAKTPTTLPKPVTQSGSASKNANRDAFLTQQPKPLPQSVRPGTAERDTKSQGATGSGSGLVNYGGKLDGIDAGPNDIVLSDSIVEIPKGEGFEAMISACGQGLLVELGIEATDREGKPVMGPDGTPKRIPLKRGMAVRKGQILGKQNDREHAANKLVAEQQLLVAKKEAEKQLEIEVARLAVQVAESEYLRAQSANEKVPGAVSPEEVVQRAYEWKRADKSAEKAAYDLDIKADEVEVRKAQVVAADAQVLDRKLVSPIDGFVDDVMQDEGQWLREGDKILKIIRLDKVQICGKIDANLYSPEMVDRKPVTIYVQKPGSPLQKVKGVITYARQVVESGRFYIYAEASNVANPQGYWLLNPGTIVTMVVHR